MTKEMMIEVVKGTIYERYKVVKGDTKKGERLKKNTTCPEGFYLSDVYENYSCDKGRAYKWCCEEFAKDENSYSFRIISHNSFAFSVAWFSKLNGHDITIIHTAQNAYCIID